MTTIAIALLGMFCWGLAPIFAKAGLRQLQPVDGLVARSLVTLSIIMAWALMAGSFRRLNTITANEWLLLGGEAVLATLAGDLAYFAAIKHGNTGEVAVILSASPIITVWAASAFLRETFSPMQLWGTILVMVGVALVAGGAP